MISNRANSQVRVPAVAGTFYPRSAKTLSATVADLLATADVDQRPRRCGVIAPHAGFAYSGLPAAHAFASVRHPAGIDRIVLVGPSHFVPFTGLALPSDEAFATPLGDMPVDLAAVEALHEERLAAIRDEPHAPEHAIEVELPFLQVVFGSLPIVPLLTGFTSADAVAAALARLWTETTLLVVSSDLSHFEDDAAARRHDARTAAAIEHLQEASIGPLDACGHLAVRGALKEAQRRGLGVERLFLCNSADVTGEHDSVVGYGAWAFYASP